MEIEMYLLKATRLGLEGIRRREISSERDQAGIACKAFRQIQLVSTQFAKCKAVIEALVQRAAAGGSPHNPVTNSL